MVIKLFTENKALTSFVILGWMAGAIAILVLSKTQNGHGDQKGHCDDDNYYIQINGDTCDWLENLRPFRFSANWDGHKNCGPVLCGWSKSTSNFHIVNSSFTLVGGIVMMVQMWSVEDKTLHLVCTIWALALGACYFSSFSIDADNVRIGNEFCQSGFGFGKTEDGDTVKWFPSLNSFKCKPAPFVFTMLAEIGLSMAAFFIFVIFFYAKWTKDTYAVKTTDSRSHSMIQVGGATTDDPSPSIQAAQQRSSMVNASNMTTVDSGSSDQNPFD